MDEQVIVNGLLYYAGLVILLTFHEFGHAWTASRCGDDTARMLGRVSLNPVVHIDPIGTVLLPMIMIFGPHSVSQFLLGWAKPVPVNHRNLHHPIRDDILVTMAGPGMNVALAIGLLILARAGEAAHSAAIADLCVDWARISLLLCFFNLIPIPPLDGSHVMRVVTNMTWETYANVARFGGIAIICLLRFTAVGPALDELTDGALDFLARAFGVY